LFYTGCETTLFRITDTAGLLLSAQQAEDMIDSYGRLTAGAGAWQQMWVASL